MGRPKHRFKAFVLFEEHQFPQLSTLARKAHHNEDIWSSVIRILNLFFPSDGMTVDAWTKLEFKISNPNLLLFTVSPERQSKELSEWVQYILHQRTKDALLVKQHRLTAGTESQGVTSGAEYTEFHNTPKFLKFVSHIREVMARPEATTFSIRCAVLLSGLSVISQWTIGMQLNLTGHVVYKELTPHRLSGDKHMVANLAEFIRDAVIEFLKLQTPLKNVVKYLFPDWVSTAILSGEIFDFFEVLEDFNWQMSLTHSSFSPAESYQDRERLEQIEQLFTLNFELFGCGGEEQDMSFSLIINKARARLYALRPLASAADPTVYNSFMESEPYGVMCWFRGSVILGLQQIARRFKNRSPSVANDKCFVPLEHT